MRLWQWWRSPLRRWSAVTTLGLLLLLIGLAAGPAWAQPLVLDNPNAPASPPGTAPTLTVGNLQAIFALAVPFVIGVVGRETWTQGQKVLAVAIVTTLAGALAASLQGQLSWQDIGGSIISVLLISQVLYRTYVRIPADWLEQNVLSGPTPAATPRIIQPPTPPPPPPRAYPSEPSAPRTG